MLRSPTPSSIFLLAALVVGGAGCKEVAARRDIQEANKLYYAGKYDEAIVLYNGALAAQPDLSIGWFNLGLSHLALFTPGAKDAANMKNAQGGIEALQKYLAFAPNDTLAQDYLLHTFIDSGHYEGAIKFFEERLKKDPTNVEAVFQLAEINSQAGKFDESIRWHLKHAEMVQSNDVKADAWYKIGVLDWGRLHNHPEIQGLERLRVADEGIAWLQKADDVRKGTSATLSYLNLLYRERATAHDASYARAVDTTSAQIYYKLATEAAKKQ